jgi:hypothetical protein
MSWMDAPPSPEELNAIPKSNWMDLPPQPHELGVAPAGPSKLESFGRGYGQTGSLGFGDEIGGAGEAIAGGVQSLLTGSNNFGDQGHLEGIAKIIDNYRRARDTNREQNDAAQNANPGTFLAGKLVGSAVPALVTGGESILGQAGANAAISGANAIGESKSSDPLTLAKEGVEAASIGGLAGGAIGAAGKVIDPLVGAGIRAVGAKASDLGEKFAVGALGNQAKIIRKLRQTGQLNPLGRELLDSGVVTPNASFENILERLSANKADVGKSIGNIDERVQKFIADNPEEGLQATGSGLSNAIRDHVITPMSRESGRVADSEALDNYLTKEFQNVYHDQPVSPAQLRDFKGKVREKVNYYGNPINQDTGRQASFNQLSQSIEDKINQTVDAVDDAGLSGIKDEYDQVMKKYGLLAEGKNLIQDRLDKIQKNRFLSPTDYLAGSVGTAVGYAQDHDPVSAALKGGAFALGNKAFRYRGNQVSATLMDKVGQVLQASPDRLGKYASVLSQAAQRGSSELGISHFVLSETDPEYREKMKEIEGDKHP